MLTQLKVSFLRKFAHLHLHLHLQLSPALIAINYGYSYSFVELSAHLDSRHLCGTRTGSWCPGRSRTSRNRWRVCPRPARSPGSGSPVAEALKTGWSERPPASRDRWKWEKTIENKWDLFVLKHGNVRNKYSFESDKYRCLSYTNY